jgi:hypothetical protein
MTTDLLHRLFKSFNAFDEPFTSAVPNRLLLFPTDGFILTETQFAALAIAAAVVTGESGAICVPTEFLELSNLPSHIEHMELGLTSYSTYVTLRDEGPILVENAIVSKSGRWCALVSQESHAIVAGDEAFIRAFQASYADAPHDIDRFVQAWQGNAQRIGSDISWLPTLVKHIGDADHR